MGETDRPRVLVVTNDFPPRVGGVQQYVWNAVSNLPPDRVSVLAPNWPGWREHDGALPFAVHRWPSTFLAPTGDLLSRVRSLVREHHADVVLFGQGLPLALLGPPLVEQGFPYVVLTHGVELWQARIPVVARALARALSRASHVTAVSEYVARFLRTAIPPGVPLTILPPGVDLQRFPGAEDGSAARERFGLDGRPVILCVARLVPRKGQDTLIRSLPVVRREIPDASLVLVGNGPLRGRLEGLAGEAPAGSVVLAGAVPDTDLPGLYAAAQVFAMPCRTRWGGLEVEGFGIVFLEAAAAARPAVAGRSGGTAEAVVDGETGLLVEGGESKAVALALVRLLKHADLAARMGRAGRARVEREFGWPRRAARLSEILSRAAG